MKIENLPLNDGNIEHRTLFIPTGPNPGMLTNRACDQSFHSVQNYETKRLANATDSTGPKVVFSPHNCNQRSYYALTSVKDVFFYNGEDYKELNILNVSLKKETDRYSLYQNLDYIPIGFTYDSYIPEAVIDSLNEILPKEDVPLQLFANIAVPEEYEDIFAKHLVKGELQKVPNLDSLASRRRLVCSSAFSGTSTGLTSQIEMPKGNFVFYSIPAEKGFKEYADGKETPVFPVNLGLSSIYVPKGKHNVEFFFIPQGFRTGLILAFCAFVSIMLVIGYEYKKQR